MKIRKNYQEKFKKTQKIEQESQSSVNCSCEILLDTSLSEVGDSDCSCSDCLEANLNAFNQLKEMQELQEETKPNNRHISSKLSQKKTINGNKGDEKGQGGNHFIGRNKSDNKFEMQNRKTMRQASNMKKSGGNIEQLIDDGNVQFTREGIEDYLKITRYRTRQYLQERKKLKKQQIDQKERLKQKIKENLQMLKYTTRVMRKSREPAEEGIRAPDKNRLHSHKWNHTPYQCGCIGKDRCLKHKIVYDPNLEQKQDQIRAIEERIRKREEEIKKMKPYECPDKCPNHHLRTSKRKIKAIQKFIKRKAKEYKKKVQQQRKQKQESEKTKQAKLRAIDIKCKDIAAKSKRIDDNISRTSFQLSIDHFSTFSDLRQNHENKMQEKEIKRKIKISDNGQLQRAVYENLDDDIQDYKPEIQSKVKDKQKLLEHELKKGKKKENKDFEREEYDQQQWCEKIVKDANIKTPKQIKQKDKERKRQKVAVSKYSQVSKQSQLAKESTLKKQQQRKKAIEKEIERKKQEILNEFQRRNTNLSKQDPKNKRLRQQYQEKLIKESKSMKKYPPESSKPLEDPYRKNYKHQPSSNDPDQFNIIGDPLIQEYRYHQKQKKKAEVSIKEGKEIFTKGGKNLMGRQVLHI